MPLAEKFEARIKRYRATATLGRDADMLHRFFALKVPYTSVIPLMPEPVVQFDFTEPVLEGFRSLDGLFYANVAEYMKGAEPEPLMTEHISPSKKYGRHLTAGFEALDREFYSMGVSDGDDDDDENGSDGEQTSGNGNAAAVVATNPQNALVSLFGDDSGSGLGEEGPTEPKRARRQGNTDARKGLAEINSQKKKKKK